MAFTDHIIGPSSIRLRRSSTAGEVPSSAMLRPGELAVNTADGRIFIGSDDGVKTIGEDNQIVSSGAISAITSSQQEDIKTGTIVTTTDGRRWVYSGSGSKVLQASYIELADITPAWAAIPDKPSTFTPSAHTHAISEVTNLQTSLDGKAASSHTHAISEVTNLQTSLDGKAASSHSHAISDVTNLQTDLDNKITKPASANDGDVLTYAAATTSWIAAAPTGGGGSFDQSLNTTDAVTFLSVSMDNGSSLSEGSFDNSTGGANGISLNCAVGYELNWQGGHLSCTTDGGVTLASIVCDSPIQFNGTGGNSVVVNGDQITFPDSTIQTTALPTASNHSDMLYWDATNSVWATTPGNPGLMPTGSSTGDIIKWDSSLGYYVSAASPVPTSASNNDILSWNGSAWIAVSPSTPGLPAASAYDVLVYDGTDWVSEPLYGGSYSPLAAGSAEGDLLSWDAAGGDWISRTLVQALPGASNNGDVLSWDSAMGIWSAQPQSGIPAPASPTTGDVLTYNGTNSTWEAAAPSSGSTPQYVRISTAENRAFPGGSPTSTGLSLVVQGSTKYVVEGLAYFSTETDAGSVEFGLQLSATTSDGDVWLDIDNFLDLDPEVVKATSFINNQNITTVITGFPSGNMGSQYAVRFRALVEVGAISSSNITAKFGTTSTDADVSLEPGSWMSATVVTT